MGVRGAVGTSQAALVFLLVLVFISNTHAIPATRVGGFVHKIPRVDLHLLDQDTNMMKDQLQRSVKKRMVAELDLDDYPGSGANSRHTPRAAFTHACSDC